MACLWVLAAELGRYITVKCYMTVELYDKHVPSVESGSAIRAENEMPHCLCDPNNGPNSSSASCALYTGTTT